MLVEGPDDSPNVVLARQRDDRDAGRSVPLVAGEDDLGALELDGILPVADNAAELLALLEG